MKTTEEQILDIENEISQINKQKSQAVELRDWDNAAEYRDCEKILQERLEKLYTNYDIEKAAIDKEQEIKNQLMKSLVSNKLFNDKVLEEYHCLCDVTERADKDFYDHIHSYLMQNDHLSYDTTISTLKMILLSVTAVKLNSESK